MKPLKRSVSLVIEGPAGVLLVRRPDDDDSLPGLWGLPAASLREGESERARAIVVEEAESFRRWVAEREVVPAIASLRARAEEIRSSELERIAGRWEGLTDADRDRLDAVTRAMLNKLLHRPTVRLKELAAVGEERPYADAMSDLFGLEPAPPAR